VKDENQDRPLRDRIAHLVAEEHRLRAEKALGAPDRDRLTAIEVELDQCWDLLRQRRALREFHEDPKGARVRPPAVVENYEQ
jgi:hypothetical protein